MADKMSKLVLPIKSGNTITEKEFDVGGGGNTFVGTSAEWEALTAEQQNAYDCRVLTDDDLDTKSVIDNLTSDSATDALSAKQGKVLKGLIDQTQGQVSDSDDAYDPTRPYAVNELCIHDNKLYRCITACSAGSWATNQSCFTADTLVNAINNGLKMKVFSYTVYNNITGGTPLDITNAKTNVFYLTNNDIIAGIAYREVSGDQQIEPTFPSYLIAYDMLRIVPTYEQSQLRIDGVVIYYKGE